MEFNTNEVMEKVEGLVKKISGDKELQKQFMAEPTKAVEKLLGVDLPDDVMERVIAGVKAKLTADDVSSLLGAVKKLF